MKRDTIALIKQNPQTDSAGIMRLAQSHPRLSQATLDQLSMPMVQSLRAYHGEKAKILPDFFHNNVAAYQQLSELYSFENVMQVELICFVLFNSVLLLGGIQGPFTDVK